MCLKRLTIWDIEQLLPSKSYSDDDDLVKEDDDYRC